MSTIRLECHDDAKNAHKYYQMRYYDGSYHVDIVYGRLPGYGRSGTARHTSRYCHSDTGARKFIENKLREKYRKGYTNIGEGDVEESIEEVSTPLKNEPIQLSGILTRIGAM
jgi:predicted DNA-binding WGR domain protein